MKMTPLAFALPVLAMMSAGAVQAAPSFSIADLVGETAPVDSSLGFDVPAVVSPAPAQPTEPANPVAGQQPQPGGWGNGIPGAGAGTVTPVLIPLSDAEALTLEHMREEEKLARDVYVTLYATWELAVFDNISSAEQNHMNTMESKVEQYELIDPVVDDATGAFQTEEFATLYQELTEKGAGSLEEALYVGGLIEELDILDLQHAIEESDHADIIAAYENLMRGSRNHLRSFVAQIENLGLVYEAQLMTQEEVDAIADSPMERGGSGH
jgi:hypothetical protein